MGSRQMNALQQIVQTIYKQSSIYLGEHPISPQDLVVRVSVNERTRSLIRAADDQYFYCGCREDDHLRETIMGGPLEVSKDMPDGVYYLDLMVYNRVQKQLKFTLQPDSDVSS